MPARRRGGLVVARVALVVVVLGGGAAVNEAAAQRYEVDVAAGTSSRQTGVASVWKAPTCAPRASDPTGFELTADHLVVRTARSGRAGRATRERLRRDGDGLTWILESDGALVVATQMRKGPFGSDRVVAIDQRGGRVLWRRSMRTGFAANLSGGRVVVDHGGELVVLAARTGREVARVPGAPGIRYACRGGDLDLVKTSGHLHGFDAATGAEVWRVPASWTAAPARVGDHVVDVWMDAATDRWGLVVLRASDGRVERRLDLDAMGPLDIVRFEMTPGGGDRLTVDATFAWE